MSRLRRSVVSDRCFLVPADIAPAMDSLAVRIRDRGASDPRTPSRTQIPSHCPGLSARPLACHLLSSASADDFQGDERQGDERQGDERLTSLISEIILADLLSRVRNWLAAPGK